jgi:hypothetical protein
MAIFQIYSVVQVVAPGNTEGTIRLNLSRVSAARQTSGIPNSYVILTRGDCRKYGLAYGNSLVGKKIFCEFTPTMTSQPTMLEATLENIERRVMTRYRQNKPVKQTVSFAQVHGQDPEGKWCVMLNDAEYEECTKFTKKPTLQVSISNVSR